MRLIEVNKVNIKICKNLQKLMDTQLNGGISYIDGLSMKISEDLNLRLATSNFDELFNKELDYLVNEI